MLDPALVVAGVACVSLPAIVWFLLHRKPTITAVKAAVSAVKASTSAAAPAPAPTQGTKPMSVSDDVAAFVADAESVASKAESFVSSEAADALTAAKAAAEKAYDELKLQYDADVAALKGTINHLKAKLAPVSPPAGGSAGSAA